MKSYLVTVTDNVDATWIFRCDADNEEHAREQALCEGTVVKVVSVREAMLPTSLHIEGRRWFQRTAGNTYHSVRIFANGALLASLPYQYGYGDQYIETALQWLHANGHISRERYDNGSYKEAGTLYLRESLGATYSVIDVARQKDL